MKTLSYFLVVVFLFGIITTGFINKTNPWNELTIQASNPINNSQLSESATIIYNRLTAINSGAFDVKTIPNTHQLLISVDGKWDLEIVKKLVLQKGKFGFYEVYNKQELAALIGNNHKLFSLIGEANSMDKSTYIACVSRDKVNAINTILNSIKTDNRCKFVWDDFSDNQEVCLYALKTSNHQEALLQNNAIIRFEVQQNRNTKRYLIECDFTATATKQWAKITQRNINKPIAITMDYSLLYAPKVQSEITGGKCQLTGSFKQIQLQCMEAIVNNGILAEPFEIVN